MKEIIEEKVKLAVAQLVKEKKVEDIDLPQFSIERTRDPKYGNLACNIALILAKKIKMNPRELADLICDQISVNSDIDKTEVAGPGFINFFLSQNSQTEIINTILDKKESFGFNCLGTDAFGKKQKVQVEFVSANPTGPLHIGHGRGAVIGDCLCRLLEASGWDVTREFYYNDEGSQIDNLARSVQLRCNGIKPDDKEWPKDGYCGEYIKELAESFLSGTSVNGVQASSNSEDIQSIREFAVSFLRNEQDNDLKSFNVKFDVYSLESDLYKNGKVENTVAKLVENGFTYEKDNALWLKTTAFGDDKDRVMRKSDGNYTYFVPDVAYHLDKWNRGYKKVINEQGADHHSTITRVRAGLQSLNLDIPSDWPEYILHQMVTVIKNGQEVKISKRSGSYVTLSDIVNQVGSDAARYFLIARRPDSQLTFDIDLAMQKNNENPVYYIQYAHARLCSVLSQASKKLDSIDIDNGKNNLNKLSHTSELSLLKLLEIYPEIILKSTKDYAPHNLSSYLKDLASAIHSWYAIGSKNKKQQVLIDEKNLRDARLCLVEATRQVISNGLNLLGISAPKKM